jgi:tetratricopeptide (TPR) repeat protein
MKYGNDHPSVAMTINNIAGVHNRQGNYDIALEQYTNELRIYVMTYGNYHPSVATTINYIAGVYYKQGKYDLALEDNTN